MTSRGRSSPGSDDARGASSTPSCITFRLITVTAGFLYDGLGCDEGQSVSSTVPSMSWRLLHSKLGGLALSLRVRGKSLLLIAYKECRSTAAGTSATRVQRVRFREAVYPLPVTALRYSFCLSFIHFRAEV